MIKIAGREIQANEITRYSAESIEMQIIKILASSGETYSYNSMEELNFELSLRREIIAAANGLYHGGMGFEIFRNSRCNPAYWNRTAEGGFKLKSGASPSGAILDIFNNGSQYGTECATAMVIVYYGALLNVFGKERFDELFSKIELMDWHHIDSRLKEIGLVKKFADYLPGDRRYFMNPDVDPLTPEWQGENVIDLNGRLYYGHGVGILNADTIIRMLNQNRDEDADEQAYLLDAAGRPDFKKLASL